MKHGYGFIRCRKCKEFTLVLWRGEKYGQLCSKCGEWMLISRQKIQQFKELQN